MLPNWCSNKGGFKAGMISRPKGQAVWMTCRGEGAIWWWPTQISQALGTAGQVHPAPTPRARIQAGLCSSSYRAECTASKGHISGTNKTQQSLGSLPRLEKPQLHSKAKEKEKCPHSKEPGYKGHFPAISNISLQHWLSFFRMLRNSNRLSAPLSWQYYISKLPAAFLGHFRRLWYIYSSN